ncbi:MAG: hypothetical protein DIZ80_07605 [endosymbiont of Galathealinum brachiosum]|uniref:GGDEF domain-containing protein n=1 Tax=endosymbiont of Galathealinum brachiosum TaxID=2200906 RepID=A0A370DGI4_9GAMM|nr:MAG: hypothetical protein DIZ80_07605 [endosymbiont of Galathealinum brachiosum]
MKNEKRKLFNIKITLIGLVVGLTFWVIASVYDYLLFYNDYITSLFMPHMSDLYYRLAIVFITTISAYLIGLYQYKSEYIEDLLKIEKVQREDAEYALKTSTVIDEETGLYTQAAAIKFLEHEVNQFQRFKTELSVVFLEIEGFSAFLQNQPESDIEKLKHDISEIVKSNIRRSDMAGHWGNNNYIMATVKTDSKQAKEVESKVRNNMNKLVHEYDDHMQVVTEITHLEESDSAMDFLNKIAMCRKAA